MVDEIKNKLSSYIGHDVTIKCNLGRNKFEKYEVTIKELYDNVFLVESKAKEKKSFSYIDILTNTIKIDY